MELDGDGGLERYRGEDDCERIEPNSRLMQLASDAKMLVRSVVLVVQNDRHDNHKFTRLACVINATKIPNTYTVAQKVVCLNF